MECGIDIWLTFNTTFFVCLLLNRNDNNNSFNHFIEKKLFSRWLAPICETKSLNEPNQWALSIQIQRKDKLHGPAIIIDGISALQ